jgi:osmotically-inducible protein OsmY
MLGFRILGVWICGFLTGATFVWFLDPARADRRRRARDRTVHRMHKARDAVRRRARYEEGHVKGLAHEAAIRTHLEQKQPLADLEETLIDKVRSEAFRDRRHELSHVNLTSVEGVVHVYGSAHDPGEADDILHRVRGVEGVREVVDHLRVAAG